MEPDCNPETKEYTLWDVIDSTCSIHGEWGHAMYVHDENGVRMTTFDGDTRVAEETGKVVLECIQCQFPRKT